MRDTLMADNYPFGQDGGNAPVHLINDINPDGTYDDGAHQLTAAQGDDVSRLKRPYITRVNGESAVYWPPVDTPEWRAVDAHVAQHGYVGGDLVNKADDARERFKRDNAHLAIHIDPSVVIDCPDVTIGVGVTIERGTRIKARQLTIGDFAYIGNDVTLRTQHEITIGDYTRINALTYGGGRKSLRIGRNVYLGRGVYLDSNGGLTLEDNTLAGAYSQLWTHVQGGDLTYGGNPKLHAEWPLIVRKDAWLVGRVAVCHAQEIGARAVVMAESNVLADVPQDTVWAGNPAKDITGKFGPQFEAIEQHEVMRRFTENVAAFIDAHPQFSAKDGYFGVFVSWQNQAIKTPATYFDPIERVYTKRRTAAEVAFIRYCLAHDLGKWTPVGES